METDVQKRERQQKALGAAFLAHQVSELEKSVDMLAFSRDPRLHGGRGGRGGRGRGGGSGESRQDKREVRVVDASALVHALPVLKRWIREDRYQLVVPLSALSTLDLLKKAPNPLHDLARDATRFLEGQLDIARQIQAAFSPADADARTRLRAQRQTEETPWSEVEKLFKVPEGWVVELPEGVEVPPPAVGEEAESLPLPTANDIPRDLRSTTQCLLHFHLAARTSSPVDTAPVGVVYNSLLATPPPLADPLNRLVAHSAAISVDPSDPSSSPRRKTREPAPLPDFLALSSGDALSYYLSTFFPSIINPLYVIPSTEVVAASSWLKAQAQAKQQADDASTRGRGGGRGQWSEDALRAVTGRLEV
ncbi:hypothetical protein Rt10032_c01g0417 [Rhodotorula toruloides]|uniref:Uncharacterized protein n=1 Tax=Rhodotorula toruloides TaxID=5286 RepID=A0A511K7T9_RHOTO|nr:hypothetical protein Rt10032_c01g0417 [Rhodotorula toruloides]